MTPLSSRLGSLFPRSPVDNNSNTESDSSMLTTRSAARSKVSNSSTSVTARATKRRSLPVPLPRLQSLSSPSMATELAQPKNPMPVIRWLGPWSRTQQPGRASGSGSNSPSGSAPPSPSLSSLNEALNENILPTALPQARLPLSFYASRALSRQPPFLDNLTPSTLPIASLSSGLPIPHDPNTTQSISLNDSESSAPQIMFHLPAGSTSMDTLRSVRDRDIHTSATVPSPSPSKPASWWWFQGDNKQNVDSLLEEEDRADSVGEEQSRLRKKYRSPKNPIVFCHGLLGFDTVSIGPSIAPMQVTHWRGIKEVLEANGIEVLITRVPATSSPVDRAKVLEKKISEVYEGRSVHLIGHSMGGLDCRYLATHLTDRKFIVLSVTTIATPHRGSSFADHFLSTIGSARMPSVLSLLDLLPNGGGDGKAFECLTTQSMSIFNERTPDVDGVRYFSWGAWYEPGLIDTWKYPHSVIMEKEGPNDGLVSVESSKWGQYLGTLEDVNHLDLVGWVNVARYKWAEITGREIKFRPATFYLGVADWLAAEVEGIPKDNEKQGGELKNKLGDGVEVSREIEGTEEAQTTSRKKAFNADKAKDQSPTGRTATIGGPILQQPQATDKSDENLDDPFPTLQPPSSKS